jgi:hypothetical protein
VDIATRDAYNLRRLKYTVERNWHGARDGKHRLTTDWANRPNVVWVNGNGDINRVSPKRVWTRDGWDYGYSQTETIGRAGRDIAYGDTFTTVD